MLSKGPYNPIKTEEQILKFWKKGRFYKPEYHPEKGLQKDLKNDKRKSFCIICPPPNANARPHLGNLSGYSYQDLMGRFHRMCGKKTLLLPGKDHAGIQSEVVFERDVLNKQGKTKFNLGREKFYKQCYEFCIKCSQIARKDEERVGLSADFERDIFTLDPEIVDIVLETFIKLYKDKQIYKGIRITNWCPKCQTALANVDCERKTQNTKLIYIKYPLCSDARSCVAYITIATTRVETMLADTAIAVNPKDKRYKKFIGKTVILPILNREIPIITDPNIDMEFGTGALKITPAHAPEDYDIMLRWNKEHPEKKIGYINTIWKDLKLYGPVGKYKGMIVKQAKKEVYKDLEREGFIQKKEDIEQNVSICERCKITIEPIMSSQWYVKVDQLRDKALKAVKNGDIKIHPKYMGKRYSQWMENLRDWPISRSLWWGYRIPAWYKGKKEEHINANGKIVETINGKELDPTNSKQIKVQPTSPGEGWIQDDDILDTWFSSGQWPFATLMKEKLMKYFYPTDVLETMYDILEWWVSRMIMLGIYRTKKIPFKDVYLHGMLLAPDGRKMSKSRGNIISMDDVVADHGADTLRQFYYVAGKAGSTYRFDWERIKYARNYLNKVWNAAKFVLINLKDRNIYKKKINDLKLGKEDKNMIWHLNNVAKDVTKHIQNFKFNLAIERLQDSFWHTFCDKYLEYSKEHLYSDKKSNTSAQRILWKCLKTYLELMHPFIPFITEYIWQKLPKSKDEPKTIMYAKWPEEVRIG